MVKSENCKAYMLALALLSESDREMVRASQQVLMDHTRNPSTGMSIGDCGSLELLFQLGRWLNSRS